MTKLNENKNIKEIYNLMGLEKKQSWMMAPNERIAILGIVETLKPQNTLELGFAEGGCTKYLSKYSKTVYTVDTNEKSLEGSRNMKNVIAYNMRTEEAFKLFNKGNLHFNLCIIDADHSTKGALRDLKSAIPLSDIIIMHDTSNPKCRKGYILALRGKDIYYDLDFIEGHVQIDGLWGGLGIVMPNFRPIKPFLTKKYSNYYYMKIKFYSTIYWILKIKSFYRIFNYCIFRIKLKFNNLK